MGGYSGGIAPFLEIRGTPWQSLFHDPAVSLPRTFHEVLDSPEIPKHVTQLTLTELFNEGDAVGSVGHSAGGYGDPLERDPHSVKVDVGRGICSPWTARHVYHVLIDKKRKKLT